MCTKEKTPKLIEGTAVREKGLTKTAKEQWFIPSIRFLDPPPLLSILYMGLTRSVLT